MGLREYFEHFSPKIYYNKFECCIFLSKWSTTKENRWINECWLQFEIKINEWWNGHFDRPSWFFRCFSILSFHPSTCVIVYAILKRACSLPSLKIIYLICCFCFHIFTPKAMLKSFYCMKKNYERPLEPIQFQLHSSEKQYLKFFQSSIKQTQWNIQNKRLIKTVEWLGFGIPWDKYQFLSYVRRFL